MRKGEAPAGLDLKDLVRAVRDRTTSCTDLERLDVAVKYGELLKGIGDDLVGHFVDEARKGGASWAQIGERLGVTKQAAHQRHVRREPRLFGRRRGTISGPEPFGRFTQSGKDVIVRAQEEARTLGCNYLGVEHLLLALTGDEVAGPLLRGAGASSEAVLAQIRQIVGEGQIRQIVGEGQGAQEGPIPFTPRSKASLQFAARRAEESNQPVEPGHILLGILELRKGVGAQILDDLGVSRGDLRRQVMDTLTK